MKKFLAGMFAVALGAALPLAGTALAADLVADHSLVSHLSSAAIYVSVNNVNQASIDNNAHSSASTGNNVIFGRNIRGSHLTTGDAVAATQVANTANNTVVQLDSAIDSHQTQTPTEVLSDVIDHSSMKEIDRSTIDERITNINAAAAANTLQAESSTGGNSMGANNDLTDGSLKTGKSSSATLVQTSFNNVNLKITHRIAR